jgi:hypothetical protein
VHQQHSEIDMFAGNPVLLQQTGSSAERLKCERGVDHHPAWSPSVAQRETQGEQCNCFPFFEMHDMRVLLNDCFVGYNAGMHGSIASAETVSGSDLR